MSYGSELKYWRSQRRFSQLELSAMAGVSARHISFLETGRSKPSREMVSYLSEVLTVPLAERNTLLTCAGFAPTYLDRELTSDDMSLVREAIDWTLERHDPFPAVALDRHWNIVKVNRAGALMVSLFGLAEGGSLLDAVLDANLMRSVIVNWDEVAEYILARVRLEISFLGGDPVLELAARQLTEVARRGRGLHAESFPAVLPMLMKVGEVELSLFSTIAQFGTADDIALADLRIELYFPADAFTRTFLENLGEQMEK